MSFNHYPATSGCVALWQQVGECVMAFTALLVRSFTSFCPGLSQSFSFLPMTSKSGSSLHSLPNFPTCMGQWLVFQPFCVYVTKGRGGTVEMALFEIALLVQRQQRMAFL